MKKKSVMMGIGCLLVILLAVVIVLFTKTKKSDSNAEETQTETIDTEAVEQAETKETAENAETEAAAVSEENSETKEAALGNVEKAVITVKDYGSIELELYPDIAPITVANFVKLVKEGFYDGLTFHRIISGFMIQGGDPLGNGMGGSDEQIKGEFEANGVKNDLSHTRGVISMARAQAMDSASSQFFIVHEDSTFLDGNYAAFGKVSAGMEIVDQICQDTPVTDNNGSVQADKQPVIESIRIMED